MAPVTAAARLDHDIARHVAHAPNANLNVDKTVTGVLARAGMGFKILNARIKWLDCPNTNENGALRRRFVLLCGAAYSESRGRSFKSSFRTPLVLGPASKPRGDRGIRRPQPRAHDEFCH